MYELQQKFSNALTIEEIPVERRREVVKKSNCGEEQLGK
jgi:hypothetical protein